MCVLGLCTYVFFSLSSFDHVHSTRLIHLSQTFLFPSPRPRESFNSHSAFSLFTVSKEDSYVIFFVTTDVISYGVISRGILFLVFGFFSISLLVVLNGIKGDVFFLNKQITFKENNFFQVYISNSGGLCNKLFETNPNPTDEECANIAQFFGCDKKTIKVRYFSLTGVTVRRRNEKS
jgi:hypothetical protein